MGWRARQRIVVGDGVSSALVIQGFNPNNHSPRFTRGQGSSRKEEEQASRCHPMKSRFQNLTTQKRRQEGDRVLPVSERITNLACAHVQDGIIETRRPRSGVHLLLVQCSETDSPDTPSSRPRRYFENKVLFVRSLQLSKQTQCRPQTVHVPPCGCEYQAS